MGRLGYVTSYYAASAHPAPERPALEGALEADVSVVGGGIAGCSTALHLAERGLQVALLEDNRIGWGASGRSGAQAIQGVAAGQAKLDRLIGPAAARAVWDVSIEGLALMRQLIRRFSIDCNWVDGYMLTAVKERHVRSCARSSRSCAMTTATAACATAARGAARDARDRALSWRAVRQQQWPPAPAQLHPGTRRGGRNSGGEDLRRHAGCVLRRLC
jgi:glycine/D-amino acid oxidase-like deaminating enzyme